MEPTLYQTFLYFFMHGPFALLVANLSPGRFKFSHTNVAYRNVKYRTLLCESPSSVFSFLHVNHFCHGISILDLVQKWPKKNSALFLPPATKLGQSYVFTRVCDSVHGGRGCYPSMHCRWYPIMPCSRSPGVCVLSQHALQVVSQHALQQVSRGWAPARGGGGLLRGVCCWGVAWWRPPGTATAAGGTHPTGMHSYHKKNSKVISPAQIPHISFRQYDFFKFIYQITCLELPLCLPSSKRWHLSVRIIIK